MIYWYQHILAGTVTSCSLFPAIPSTILSLEEKSYGLKTLPWGLNSTDHSQSCRDPTPGVSLIILKQDEFMCVLQPKETILQTAATNYITSRRGTSGIHVCLFIGVRSITIKT